MALAILALALAAALPQFGTALRLGGSAADAREAVLVARSALAALAADPALADGTRDGADGGWRWRAAVKALPSGERGAPVVLRPFEVTVAVAVPDGPPLVRLTTVVLGRGP